MLSLLLLVFELGKRHAVKTRARDDFFLLLRDLSGSEVKVDSDPGFHGEVRARTAFSPPKANEFDSTASTAQERAVLGR